MWMAAQTCLPEPLAVVPLQWLCWSEDRPAYSFILVAGTEQENLTKIGWNVILVMFDVVLSLSFLKVAAI